MKTIDEIGHIMRKSWLPWSLGSIIICLYYLPYLILGENAYIIPHDFLDIVLPHTVSLLEQHAVWDYDKIMPIMDGIPRHSYIFGTSSFDLQTLIYASIPAYWAVVVNSFLVKIVAFAGMNLLLKDYVLNINTIARNWIALICALCFSFIPFWHGLELSSAGFPLIFWAFFNLRDKKNLIVSFLSIILFVTYSWFAIGGLFVCFVLGVYYLYLIIWNKQWYGAYLLGLVLMGCLCVLVNIDLFSYVLFHSEVVMHRVEFHVVETISEVFQDTANIVWCTGYHSGSIYTLPIMLFVAFSLFLKRKDNRRLWLTLSLIAITFSIYALSHLFMSIIGDSLLNSFNFDRFCFFLPMLWIVALALSMENILYVCRKRVLLYILPILPLMYLTNYEYITNLKLLCKIPDSRPSFSQFFDEQLFDDIKADLSSNPDMIKTVSIGLFPSIAEYNGFYTLDAYINLYPLSYKYEFRKVIEKELDKSEELKNYFDNWGSRCYVFSSELGQNYMYGKDCGVAIHHLDVNTEQLRKMGCQYVFSAVPILNYDDLNWEFEKAFTTDKSFWKIYVYRIYPD